MRYLPTIRSVNILYLITLLLVVIIGSIAQAISPSWGLIITEVFLILLPSLLFLRIIRYPVRETVRLRWPGGRLAALSLLIGIGFALLALWLGNVLVSLFGYSFSLPPGFYPANLVQALVLFSALAFFAPVCEEFMFRGIIQRGYERLGASSAIILVGIYFSVYHLSFQRLFAIAPVALVLGYVAWRGDSLFASMLVHSSYNALAGILLLIGTFRPDLPLDLFGSLPVAVLGAALGALGLWLFSRTAPVRATADRGRPAVAPDQEVTATAGMTTDGGPQTAAAAQDMTAPAVASSTPTQETFVPETSSRLGRAWPIAVAFLIFLFLAGLEFISGRFPQVLALGPLEFAPVSWRAPVAWSYELRNILDEPVGTAECSLAPQDALYQLDCQVRQQAFEARKGSSYYKTAAYELQQTARWQRDTLHLLSAEGVQQGNPGGIQWSLTPSPSDGLVLSVSSEDQQYEDLTLPNQNTLLEHEWPWRLQALPFSLSYSRRVTHAWPLHWSEAAQASVPLAQEEFVVVAGAEPLGVPAGNFIAWRVELGDQTAWYDSAAPHTLLRYDDGMVSYVLKEIVR